MTCAFFFKKSPVFCLGSKTCIPPLFPASTFLFIHNLFTKHPPSHRSLPSAWKTFPSKIKTAIKCLFSHSIFLASETEASCHKRKEIKAILLSLACSALPEYGNLYIHHLPTSIRPLKSSTTSSLHLTQLGLINKLYFGFASPLGPSKPPIHNVSLQDTEAVYVSARQNSRPSTLRPSPQATAFSQPAETL